ncbi:MAG: cell division protein ZapD [Gammaproteobacteria bacterium]|nr:cell division protein ZapD [Gammaproteobacteria bacterium]
MKNFNPSATMISDNIQSDSINFEVPLDNKSRSLLRLERVFRETNRHIKIATPSAHFFALKQIFFLLDFFERGDFKAELIKELDRDIAYFTKLNSNPEVDLSKLEVFINQLGQLSKWFSSQKGKIGHQLLEQEFILNAKNKLTLGSVLLSFDAPFVELFLSMPIEKRQQKLYDWLKAFKGIQTSVEVLLRLSRETSTFATVIAENGYYQRTIRKNEFKFIGIRVPADFNIYPEVSTDQKRFNIRFMALSDDLEAKQFSDWFNFELAFYT